MNRYRPSRNVFLIGLTSFFNDLSSEMVLAVFPAFFISVLKTGASSLGLVEGLADGAANIIKIYSGRLSDKIQKRKVFMVVGYTLSVATRPMYLIASTVSSVVGLRFADRIGKGVREAPRDAIISLSTSKGEIGRAFGFHRTLDTLGGIAGPLVAYFILRAYPGAFDTIFITAFIFGLFAVASLFLIKDAVGVVKTNNLTLETLADFSPDFRHYLIALFLLSAGSMPIAVLLLKTKAFGLTIASIPLFYMLYNISYAVFSMSGGRASDTIGPRKVICYGYLLLILGYAIISLTESVTGLVIGFLVLGLFPAFTDGVTRALATELSPETRRAGAYGLVNATIGFGLMTAGIGGGYLWEYASPSVALIVASALVLVGIAMISITTHRSHV